MTILSERLAILNERLAMPRLKLPTSVDRRLLAYFHSGEVMRHFLPKLIRISAVIGLILSTIYWLSIWPEIYKNFERWGLVKMFLAQVLALATFLLLTRITILRARHLEAFPADDFVTLRTTAVLCRWVGEVPLVLVLGMFLISFLVPASLPSPSILGSSPAEGSESTLGSSTAEGSVSTLGSSPTEGSESTLSPVVISAIAVLAVIPFFLFFYAVATAIDLSLAIEFNTRAERVGKEMI